MNTMSFRALPCQCRCKADRAKGGVGEGVWVIWDVRIMVMLIYTLM